MIRFPVIAKLIALVLFLGVATLLGTQLAKRFNPVKEERVARKQLKADLTADFQNFRYVHYEGGRNRYMLTAAKDKVFSDSHHELEQVKLEVYDEKGQPSGQITSDRCRYDQSQGLVHFESNVFVETVQGLKVKTNSLDYRQQSEMAETPDPVEFAQGRTHGNCRGMLLDSRAERLEMKAAVHITIEPEGAPPYLLTNGAAPAAPERPAKPEKEQKKKKNKDKKKKDKQKAKAKEKQDEEQADGPVVITGDWAEYTGKDRIVRLNGDAKIAETDRFLSANKIKAFLTPAKTIDRVEARGNSLLESLKPEMTARVSATDIDFYFDEKGNLTRAEARGQARAETLELSAGRTLTAEQLTVFTVPGASGSEVQHIKATGGVYLKIDAPVPTVAVDNPVVKELRSQEAELYYHDGGEFIREARAQGRVVMVETPARLAVGAERRTMTAERATLLFFESGNDARALIAEGGVKIEAEPYEPGAQASRERRITESERAEATFDRATGGLATAIQEGNFKYVEGKKNALADRAIYSATQARIELRGSKVVVWDDVARTYAEEIDLLTVKQESLARGRVRSTYYNPGSAGQATPFRNMKSPVFITAKAAHVYNQRGEAIYTGEARAWQEDNFVRGDKIELYREARKMIAEGNVSSALYQARGQQQGSVRAVPVFATSATLKYLDQDRLAEYQGAVKMRQGEETLEAERVKIFLAKQANEVERMAAYERVVMTQPGRRAEGDEAEYTAEDQRTVLVGNMARVVSQLQGTVTGRRLTLMGGDDRIFADDQRGTKRIRSTHEVQR